MKLVRKYYENFEQFLKKIIVEKLSKKEISLVELITSSTKVLFVVIPLIVAITVLILFLSINAEVNSLKNNMLNILEVGFTENLKSSMNTNDFLQVRNTLNEIRNLEAIDEVTLVDRNKKVIISDDLKKEGNIMTYSDLDIAFTKENKYQPVRSDNGLTLVFENQQRCQRCHMNDDKILGGLVVRFSSLDSTGNALIYVVVFFVIGVFIVFLSKVFFSVIADKYINMPINTLLEVSKSISQGKTIKRKPITSPIEFRYLYGVLSKMVEDLNEYVEEIKKKNSEKEQIKILAGIGEMAAKVAHEVRNPLNTIDGAIHFLRKTSKESDTIEYLELIEDNIHRINNVASELLDATRPSKPVLEKVSIVKVFRERIQEFSDNYDLSTIEINIEAERDIPVMFADKHQIIQVVDNLLENAINACEDNEKGVINISVKKIAPTPMQNFLLLKFFDNGTGIDKENLEKAFMPFFTTRPSGTGLGLSIVEKIISNHRGSIKLSSKRGKGTIVRIKLPIRT